ncbi:MAG: PIN domain-containing protein [Thermaerobacter sp.]|nr:PIN domain-containing protein [Thermaerobacter sp.]
MSANEREFVDSNVIVYAHDRSPKSASEQAKARELMERLWLQGNGCVSVQVLQECFVTVTRKLVRPLDVDQAYALLEDLTAWRVHSPNAEDVLAAVRIHREHVISLWDALIVQSARALGCATLWTQDLNDGQVIEGVLVQNPLR